MVDVVGWWIVSKSVLKCHIKLIFDRSKIKLSDINKIH